jgi:hypothetical protein
LAWKGNEILIFADQLRRVNRRASPTCACPQLPAGVNRKLRISARGWHFGIGAIWLVFAVCSFSAAETLSGTLTNGTTEKPAAGDEVILIKLGQGMEEAARTKADAKGNFSFMLDKTAAPHLVRAIHQGVTYHRMAPPGTSSIDIRVYDVGRKLEGIGVTADVMRFQAQGGELQGIRLFAVNNASDPPRTQMNDQNFEFYLPEGAQIDQAEAMTAGGQPLKSTPVPQQERNRYAFVFPLRPGETQFQLAFHMSYDGGASIDPKSLYGTQHFVVMLPKSMQFAAGTAATFQSMKDPNQSDAIVQVASNTKPGQSLAFKISGTGLLSDQPGSDQAGSAQPGGPGPTVAGRDSRPGGGIGPPIDAPDPLAKYRGYILGGFAVVLAGGAFYIVKRPSAVANDVVVGAVPATSTAPKASSDRTGVVLEALKEELFQLEVEHKQGRVSQQEYEKVRAALGQTLERTLKRVASR